MRETDLNDSGGKEGERPQPMYHDRVQAAAEHVDEEKYCKYGLWSKTVPSSSPGLTAIKTWAGNLTSLSLASSSVKTGITPTSSRCCEH